MGVLDKLSEAMQLSEEKKDSLHCVMRMMMSQCQELSEAKLLREEQKQSLHSAMGLVMLHCHELEAQLNHTTSCFSDCYKELQGKEEKLKSVADTVAQSLESFNARRSSLAEGLEKMKEKDTQLNGLLSKVNEELKDVERKKKEFSAASTCMDVWEAELSVRENEIESRGREITLKEDELRVREREVESKEDDVNRIIDVLNKKKDGLYDKDCRLYSKEGKLQKWEDDLDAREMILDSKEIDHFLAEKDLEEMKQKVRDLGHKLLHFTESPVGHVRKRSRETEMEAKSVDSMVLYKGSAD